MAFFTSNYFYIQNLGDVLSNTKNRLMYRIIYTQLSKIWHLVWWLNCTRHLDTRSSPDPCSQYLLFGFVSKDQISSWLDIYKLCDLREVPCGDIYNRGSGSSNSLRWVKLINDFWNMKHKRYTFGYILSWPDFWFLSTQNRFGIQNLANGQIFHFYGKKYIQIVYPKFLLIPSILLYQDRHLFFLSI